MHIHLEEIPDPLVSWEPIRICLFRMLTKIFRDVIQMSPDLLVNQEPIRIRLFKILTKISRCGSEVAKEGAQCPAWDEQTCFQRQAVSQ